MFKFFRKKQAPAPTPAPEAKAPPAPPVVPDAGGWGRHAESEPPKPAAGELPPGESRVAPGVVPVPPAAVPPAAVPPAVAPSAPAPAAPAVPTTTPTPPASPAPAAKEAPVHQTPAATPTTTPAQAPSPASAAPTPPTPETRREPPAFVPSGAPAPTPAREASAPVVSPPAPAPAAQPATSVPVPAVPTPTAPATASSPASASVGTPTPAATPAPAAPPPASQIPVPAAPAAAVAPSTAGQAPAPSVPPSEPQAPTSTPAPAAPVVTPAAATSPAAPATSAAAPIVAPPAALPPAAPAAPPTVATPQPGQGGVTPAPAPTVSRASAGTAPAVGGKPRKRPGPPPKRARFETAAPAPAAAQETTPAKSSWLSRLRSGLAKTGQSFTQLFVNVKVDEDLFEELETALVMSDAGVDAADKLLTALRARVRKERVEDGNRVKEILRELLTEHLKPLERPFDLTRASPLVVMIAGVNGAGKTTSIGKLARHFQEQDRKVLLAAGDTFRAAAREQLVQWGERNNVAVVAQADGSDPAAVAFDAVHAGRARGMGVVMIDTAGRLPTQLHLMAELQKIRRVIAKAEAEAPHEVLLVVDGNTGQNALAQIKAFDEAIGLTGLVVTKLDGTAKGGILAAVASGANGVRPVPVYWIGVGEEVEDLQPFVAAEFAGALLGGNGKD